MKSEPLGMNSVVKDARVRSTGVADEDRRAEENVEETTQNDQNTRGDISLF